MNVVTLSPKGKITIPKKYRNRVKTKHYSIEMKGTTMILKPVQMKVIEESVNDFGNLSEKAFEFWNDPKDDIYEKFYKDPA